MVKILARESKILVLNLPSPPHMDVCRDYAGGFGVAWATKREHYGQSVEPCFHPFLPYAAAVLSNEGFSYEVLDCQQRRFNESQVVDAVRRTEPDAIFSLIGLPSLSKDVELLGRIKDLLPNTFVAGVGTACRFLFNEILSKGRVDAVLMNSYPYVSSIAQLLEALDSGQDLKTIKGLSYMKNQQVVTTEGTLDQGLDKLPLPNYDKIELTGYSCFEDKDGARYPHIPVLTGKGCPYSCYYCPYPVGFDAKWTHKSPNDIADEVEYLYSRGFQGFTFRDQSFPISKHFTTQVCEEIIRRKLDIAWVSEARADQVSRDLLGIMKKSGCRRIHYGVETGDAEILRLAKPRTSMATMRKAFRLAKEFELWTNAHVILGWPEESLKTLASTYRFMLELNPDSVNWNILTPYPGTRVYKIAKESNLILTCDWSKYTSHTIVMRTKWLDGNQLQEAITKMMKDYSRHRFVRALRLAGKKPKLAFNEMKEIVIGHFI